MSLFAVVHLIVPAKTPFQCAHTGAETTRGNAGGLRGQDGAWRLPDIISETIPHHGNYPILLESSNNKTGGHVNMFPPFVTTEQARG